MIRWKLVPVGAQFMFRLAGKKNQGVKFAKEFYGYIDQSHHGRYRYERKGFLSKMPHLKPRNSTVIVRLEDAVKIREFLRKRNVKFSESLIILSPSDARALKITHRSKLQNWINELKGSKNFSVKVDF